MIEFFLATEALLVTVVWLKELNQYQADSCVNIVSNRLFDLQGKKKTRRAL